MLLTWLLNFKVELETPILAITIVKIGGLDKTTLAKLAFSNPIVQEHFQVKKCVCNADNFFNFDASSIPAMIVGCNNNDDMELVLEKLKTENKWTYILTYI